MKVVLVSSEVAPFSKTGGLGDVCGALAAALARRGHTVVTVSPRYGPVDAMAVGAEDTGVTVDLPGAGTRHRVRYLRVVSEDGVHHLLIEHPMFDRDGIYGDANGTFGDNHLRFSILGRAAIEATHLVPVRGEPLGEDVVFHAHDWQGALVPLLLEAAYRPMNQFVTTPSVLTVHNLRHQGHFAGRMFADLDLPPRWFAPWALEYYSDLNLLKGGLHHTDQITTVSPTYAAEIRTQIGGFGLDGVLRSRQDVLTGILNGIDAQIWNPATDPLLPANYDANDLTGKKTCKAALQTELGLSVDAATPLIGSVGRLDPQKGTGLLIESIPWLVEKQDAQVVVLGDAPAEFRRYEERLRQFEQRYPRHVRAWMGFSEAQAHQIEAGADLYAMPSRFEPCGLNQMYSMRYGTPPVVRAVGGLADSVQPALGDCSAGTGWVFHLYDGHHLRDALYQALSCWRDRPEAFRAIQGRGMAVDWSWDAVVPAYEAIYERARAARGEAGA
ncbi:MAG: glycogen synthase [Deltaproteobacteria bacterium]|nr:glycogen synthase [Deltaproteobacteria bacterium]